MKKTFKMLHKEQQIGEKLEVYIPRRNQEGASHRQIALELDIDHTELSLWLGRLGLRTVSRIIRDREPMAAA